MFHWPTRQKEGQKSHVISGARNFMTSTSQVGILKLKFTIDAVSLLILRIMNEHSNLTTDLC